MPSTRLAFNLMLFVKNDPGGDAPDASATHIYCLCWVKLPMLLRLAMTKMSDGSFAGDNSNISSWFQC